MLEMPLHPSKIQDLLRNTGLLDRDAGFGFLQPLAERLAGLEAEQGLGARGVQAAP